MVIFNGVGAIIFLIVVIGGAIAGGVLGAVTGDEDLGFSVAFLVLIPVGVALDLIYRSRNNPAGWTRLINPTRGGQFFFIPVWVIGIFAIFMLFLG